MINLNLLFLLAAAFALASCQTNSGRPKGTVHQTADGQVFERKYFLIKTAVEEHLEDVVAHTANGETLRSAVQSVISSPWLGLPTDATVEGVEASTPDLWGNKQVDVRLGSKSTSSYSTVQVGLLSSDSVCVRYIADKRPGDVMLGPSELNVACLIAEEAYHLWVSRGTVPEHGSQVLQSLGNLKLQDSMVDRLRKTEIVGSKNGIEVDGRYVFHFSSIDEQSAGKPCIAFVRDLRKR